MTDTTSAAELLAHSAAGRALTTDELCRRCDENGLHFESTDELEGEVDAIGQERAQDALDFGFGMQGQGWNLFVLGQPRFVGSVQAVINPVAIR